MTTDAAKLEAVLKLIADRRHELARTIMTDRGSDHIRTGIMLEAVVQLQLNIKAELTLLDGNVSSRTIVPPRRGP